MEHFKQLLNETIQFLNKGFDEDNTEILPKVVVSIGSIAVAVIMNQWLPDHDPANRTAA